jgi:aldehyde dehydrogenase family 7 protein A1
VTKLIQPILERNGLPGAAAALVCGDIDVGKELVGSPDIPLGELMLGSIIEKSGDWRSVSFTGSEKVGKEVAKNVQDRFGKVLLELGGNNGEYMYPLSTWSIAWLVAVIVDKDADLKLALQGVLFAAVGTA